MVTVEESFPEMLGGLAGRAVGLGHGRRWESESSSTLFLPREDDVEVHAEELGCRAAEDLWQEVLNEASVEGLEEFGRHG